MIKEYGYEYDSQLKTDLWEATKGRTTQERLFDAISLRSGRDALKSIAMEFKPRIALLPALSCDSMVFPFEMYGHKVQFYKLNPDYSVDVKWLKSNIKQDFDYFLLIMDYFGNPAIDDDFLYSLKSSHNIIFIEDRTQNLLSKKYHKFNFDFTVASLRKWLAIPDGGLLWGNIAPKLGNDTVFSSTRLKGQILKNMYSLSGDESLKKEYRKIFSNVSKIMDSDGPCAMSAYSYHLVKGTDLTLVQSKRERNAEMLSSYLSSCKHIRLIQNTASMSALYVPFVVENRDLVQKELSANRIYNTIIWPLSPEQEMCCNVAEYTHRHMLAAPCDQRYNLDDMKYIGKEIVKVVTRING